MPVLDTSTLAPGKLDAHSTLQVYNGLDCCLTFEIFEKISPQLQSRPNSQTIYDFERAMQAPALDMMLRGWAIDIDKRDAAVDTLRVQLEKVQAILDEFAYAVWDRPLNPRSPKQLAEFFYGVMKLPEQHAITKGVRRVSTNREALEKLSAYFIPLPLINCILKLRDITKKISVLTSEVDTDLRIRTSYNVTGTETGRWSSSGNVWGGGTNLQNITPELRDIFIADPGKKLAYIDLEQAESRAVGWLCWCLFGLHAYLDACESGDLHTTVCRMVWNNLGWTGVLKEDKEIAERPYYRQFSYRDLSKRGGHGTNYYGKPPTVARNLKVETYLIEDFQRAYFKQFPEIQKWHQWTARELQLNQKLVTPLGMERIFFGRPGDDATLREAIAFVPQSMVGQLLNLALWRVWRYAPEVQLLGQVHDAIVVQYDDNPATEAATLNKLLGLMATPLEHNGRRMVIPSTVEIGWNWGKVDKKKLGPDGKPSNPDGMIKWGGTDERRRSKSPSVSRLDRILSRVH